MKNIEETIKENFLNALEQTDKELLVPSLEEDTILLESGLDSLGFAILVATLEEELDLDPFQELESAVYPKTYGEFIKIYSNAAK